MQAYNETFMQLALELALQAAAQGEVPVGAVIVKDGAVIATGRNRREQQKNALCHAEIEVIDKACRALGGWRLPECELYVTLEPCPMCAGAIINARIPQIFFGASDQKAGACGSVVSLFELPFNHRPLWTGGMMQEKCSAILSEFFQQLRKK